MKGLELLATALVQGTIVVAFTAVLAALFRRARPAFLAALWTIALIKFAVPVAPEAPFALATLFADHTTTLLGSGAPVVSDAAAPVAAASARPLPVWPMLAMLALLVWAGGALFVLGRRLRRHIRLARRARRLPLVGSGIRAAAEAAAADVGILRLPELRSDARAPGAYLVGWLQPVLVVPAWADGAGLRAMLLHELAHVRRRDPLVRLVQLAVTSAFFFWPPVLWASRRLDLLREQACDAWAITAGGLRPSAYARVLLDVARKSRQMRPGGELSAPALSMAARPGQLEKRVRHLMTRRQRPALSVSLALLLLGWSAVALASASSRPAPAGAVLCATDPRIGEQILASYPDADVDGDGRLSKEEICAHQLRMQRKVVDHVVEGLPDSRLRHADLDGDGRLSQDELDALKERLVVSVRSEREPQQSRLVLRLADEAMSLPEFADVEQAGFAVSTAEVAGQVCEPESGRCAESEDPSTDESFLLIDVAVRDGD